MGWLQKIFRRKREKQAQNLIQSLFDHHGLELAPDFPDFVAWLYEAPLQESAKSLSKALDNDPDFPRNGPYPEIRAYFDKLFREEPELEEMAGQLAFTWMMQKAAHKKVRVRDT